MKINDLASLPSREVFPGYTGRFIHAENMTIAYWRIKANHPLPEHSHHHEQVVHVVKGTPKPSDKDAWKWDYTRVCSWAKDNANRYRP